MQSRWNTWEQQPKAMERPFSLLGEGLAWYSMEGSLRLFRQMAHVSAHMSHDHIVTAFHFLISKRGAAPPAGAVPVPLVGPPPLSAAPPEEWGWKCEQRG